MVLEGVAPTHSEVLSSYGLVIPQSITKGPTSRRRSASRSTIELRNRSGDGQPAYDPYGRRYKLTVTVFYLDSNSSDILNGNFFLYASNALSA